MMADIFGNIIASHHGGLCDAIADGKQTILKRTNGREEELSYDEAKEAFHPAIAAEAIRTEILRFCMKSRLSTGMYCKKNSPVGFRLLQLGGRLLLLACKMHLMGFLQSQTTGLGWSM